MRDLATKADLNSAIEHAVNRVTIRLGSIVIVATAALGVFIALFLN